MKFTSKNLLKKLVFFNFLLLLTVSFETTAQDHSSSCEREYTHDYNNHTYELWQNQNWADGCIYIKTNGDFYTSWSSINNTLARKSKRPGVNNQKIDFYVNSDFSGNVFYGAYGWWRNEGASGHAAAVEYYVVENWGIYRPIDCGNDVGDLVTEEGTYDIYICEKTNQPSVYPGINNFTQIKCIRKDGQQRSSGTITMANHFNAWADYGWPIGDLFEVSMKIEGYSNGANDPTSGGAYVVANFGTAGNYTGGSSTSGGASGTSLGLWEVKSNASSGNYATSNNSDWSIVKETGHQSNWSSQKWELKRKSGNEYYLTEQYGNRLLTADGANRSAVKVHDFEQGWDSQVWIIVDSNWGNTRIKNKWTNRYLTSPNSNWGTLTTTNSGSGSSRRWNLISQGNNSMISNSTNEIEEIAIGNRDFQTDNNSNNYLNIYPNPASNFIHIDLPIVDFETKYSASIYDLQGKILREINLLSNSNKIDISGLATGVYIMKVDLENKRTIKKINVIR